MSGDRLVDLKVLLCELLPVRSIQQNKAERHGCIHFLRSCLFAADVDVVKGSGTISG